MGDGSSPPGLLAQLANLGGTCDQALKFDNLLRSRGPQQPLSAEFVAVTSQAPARTRVGNLHHQARWRR